MHPWLLRGILLLASTSVSLIAAEVLLRVVGGLPQPALYLQDPDGIRLRSHAQDDAALAMRHAYTLITGEHGLRASSIDWRWSEPAWLVLGDSQALGLGVEHGETFSALVTARGVPMVSAGVPSYGLEDALARGRRLLADLQPPPLGVVVVVNQANDWDEAGSTITERFEVAGGWLLPSGRTSPWHRRFFGSSLSHVHLLHLPVTLVARAGGSQARKPVWARDADGAAVATTQLAKSITTFVDGTDLPVVVAYMPLDVAVSAERVSASVFGAMLADDRPWEDASLPAELAASLKPVGLVDLSPVLRDQPAAFLDGDYHLSPVGHRRVADALIEVLP